MPSIQLESLSSFGRLAVALDAEFAELTRLSGQIQRLDIDSDSGLDRAVKLLDQFAQHGQKISDGVQSFSSVLQEARQRSEDAAKRVMERAELIGRRKKEQNEMREQLGQVEQNVANANAELSSFRRDGKSGPSGEQQSQIRTQLEKLNVDLKKFLADAQAIKESAARAKFKTIERDAQNLIDVLRSTSRRVDKVL